MNPSEPTKSPREVAEAIAALHGEKPEVITVKMLYTDEVNAHIACIQDAVKRAHSGPVLHIRAAA